MKASFTGNQVAPQNPSARRFVVVDDRMSGPSHVGWFTCAEEARQHVLNGYLGDFGDESHWHVVESE